MDNDSLVLTIPSHESLGIILPDAITAMTIVNARFMKEALLQKSVAQLCNAQVDWFADVGVLMW